MNECPPLPLGRAMLAVAFLGPGGMHVLDAWRNFEVSSSVAVSLMECAAGVAVVLGWQARPVGIALAAFLLGDAFAAHRFWQPAPDQESQLLHFFKNVALAGAFLLHGAHRNAGFEALWRQTQMDHEGRSRRP